MEELIFSVLVLALGVGVHQVAMRFHTEKFEHQLLTRSFLAHLAAAFGLILVYRYYYVDPSGAGTGDLNMYHQFGVPIAEALRYDFGSVAPEVWALFTHGDYHLPIEPFGYGSTGTMQSVAVALLFVLGNSLVAASLVIAVMSYVSKILIYRALRSDFSPQQHRLVLLAVSLSPTGVVWTCAMLKEPIIMVVFGPIFLALKWVLEGRRLVLATILIALCGTIILLIKPYVVIALALAGAVWIFWARTVKSGTHLAVKPLYIAVAIGVASLGFSTVSALAPSLSPDRVAESMQEQRRAAALSTGGSDFSLGPEPEAVPERGIISQAGLMPLALVTALFRPFLFESFSAMQFLNAIEMTWLTVLFIQMVRRNTVAGLVRRVTENPTLMFCLAFVLVLALGTGLSTSNLGALSRYRAPMMPFFLLLLLLLRQPESAPSPSGAISSEALTKGGA
ncbi:MAG: hypothetical protein QM817_42040 [Archangium sp.]